MTNLVITESSSPTVSNTVSLSRGSPFRVLGIKVVILEASPWYGNKKWVNPNREHGLVSSYSMDDLDINLLRQWYTKHEHTMNSYESGRFRQGQCTTDAHRGTGMSLKTEWFGKPLGKLTASLSIDSV